MDWFGIAIIVIPSLAMIGMTAELVMGVRKNIERTKTGNILRRMFPDWSEDEIEEQLDFVPTKITKNKPAVIAPPRARSIYATYGPGYHPVLNWDWDKAYSGWVMTTSGSALRLHMSGFSFSNRYAPFLQGTDSSYDFLPSVKTFYTIYTWI